MFGRQEAVTAHKLCINSFQAEMLIVRGKNETSPRKVVIPAERALKVTLGRPRCQL
jgi:hypothetical protein